MDIKDGLLMPDEEMKELHLKIGMKEYEKLKKLADYYHTLGSIEKPTMVAIIKYSLNCLHAGTRREIESRRYGVK